MTDEDLATGARTALGALKGQRGACPLAETLVEYETLAPDARARRPEHAHIQVCSRCQLLLLHMADPKPAPSRLGWLLPLAAVAVLALGISLVDWRSDPATPADTVRGSEIQAVAPAGTVTAVTEFSWQSPIQSDRYRVTVRHGPDQVWQSEAAATRVAPPQNLFERGVEYSWQVEAIDREGDVRMVSPPQPFVIR